MSKLQLQAFGCGYVATELARQILSSGGSASGTCRTPERASSLKSTGITPQIWPDVEAGSQILPTPGAMWLISVPPDQDGCPVYRAFSMHAASASWIGYLSTTGVYGDLAGRWAFEWTSRNPQSPEAERRARAEDQWRSAGAQIFRLPGIYGPGRSQLQRVRSPTARRIIKPGQVFSRAHRDDIVSALMASIRAPRPGASYNVCDDEPAPSDLVLSYAAELLGIEPPPATDFEKAELSSPARRFYAECKRVSNALIKAELGWRPAYPTYREGLLACLQADSNSS